MHSSVTHNIVVLLVIKLCSKAVEQQFGVLSPENFKAENGTCQLTDVFASGTPSARSAAAWLYSTKFILPVLGGVLADMYVGHYCILVLFGYTALFSTVLLAVSLYRSLICQSIAVVVVIWVPVTILFGIVQPAFFFELTRWHSSVPAMWSLLAVGYYCFLKTGELIGLLLPHFWSSIGSHFILIYIGLCIVYIPFSSWLSSEVHRVPFVMPTRARMIRFCKAFTFMAMFLVSVMHNRSVVYVSEIRYFLNATCPTCKPADLSNPLLAPEVIKVFSQVFWTILLLYSAYRSRSQLPVEPRLFAGISLEALVSASLLAVVSIAPPSNLASVRVFFLIASTLDGLAEILTCTASHELMLSVAPNSSKFLVFGVFFTVWGLANVAGYGLLAALNAVALGNPALRPFPDKMPLFFVYHLVILVLMVLSLAHYRFCARSLIVILSLVEDDDTEEMRNCESDFLINRAQLALRQPNLI